MHIDRRMIEHIFTQNNLGFGDYYKKLEDVYYFLPNNTLYIPCEDLMISKTTNIYCMYYY